MPSPNAALRSARTFSTIEARLYDPTVSTKHKPEPRLFGHAFLYSADPTAPRSGSTIVLTGPRVRPGPPLNMDVRLFP